MQGPNKTKIKKIESNKKWESQRKQTLTFLNEIEAGLLLFVFCQKFQKTQKGC